MKVRWNKVTWYSQLVAILLFVGVFALGFYVGKNYAETDRIWHVLQ